MTGGLRSLGPPKRAVIKGQDHFLAYITQKEAELLRLRGGGIAPGGKQMMHRGVPVFADADSSGDADAAPGETGSAGDVTGSGPGGGAGQGGSAAGNDGGSGVGYGPGYGDPWANAYATRAWWAANEGLADASQKPAWLLAEQATGGADQKPAGPKPKPLGINIIPAPTLYGPAAAGAVPVTTVAMPGGLRPAAASASPARAWLNGPVYDPRSGARSGIASLG